MKWIGGVIAILIIVGGLYFYKTRNSYPTLVSSPNTEVTLAGTLEVKKLNGQSVLFLELTQPINIKGSGEDMSHQASYSNISEIQLDSSPVVMDLSDTSGQKSEVTGTLQDAQTNGKYTSIELHIHTMHGI